MGSRLFAWVTALWLLSVPVWAGTCPDAEPTAETTWQRIGPTIVALSQKTTWQPVGEEILLTLSSDDVMANVDVAVCFRWVLENGYGEWQLGRRVRPVDVQGKSATFGVTVPAITKPVDGKISSTFFFVRDAQALMVVRKGDKLSGYLVPFGVSHGGMGAISVGLFLLFIVSLFYAAAPRRAGLSIRQRVNRAILYIISSGSNGTASLSQFQLVLWLCVVGCCIIDVMALSGDLISVPDQMLGLLGISSAAMIGARVMSDQPRAAVAPASPSREPAWRDLIEVDGQVDVTRLQMLVFTVVTALFVVMRTFASYEFPNLDNSYLLLMGIANGSYLLGKVKSSGGGTGTAEAALPRPQTTPASGSAVQPAQ